MAKILFTAFLADARNKLNGSVFSKNRYGNYVRNKVTPVNPQTSYQQAQRQMLASLSTGWRGLTQAQRDAWIAGAGAFQRTDIFGKPIILAGNALYIALNKNLINAGSTKVDDIPTPVTVPSIAISDLTAAAGTPALSFTIDPTTIPSGFVLFVKATGQISPGKQYVKNLLRWIGLGTATTGSVDILSDYNDRFGSLVEGKRITVQAYLVSSTTGQAGIPVQATAIVGA